MRGPQHLLSQHRASACIRRRQQCRRLGVVLLGLLERLQDRWVFLGGLSLTPHTHKHTHTHTRYIVENQRETGGKVQGGSAREAVGCGICELCIACVVERRRERERKRGSDGEREGNKTESLPSHGRGREREGAERRRGGNAPAPRSSRAACSLLHPPSCLINYLPHPLAPAPPHKHQNTYYSVLAHHPNKQKPRIFWHTYRHRVTVGCDSRGTTRAGWIPYLPRH